MKFETTAAFDGDWRRLPDGERARFRRVVVHDFHPACERRHADPAEPWPRSLRVRGVVGVLGVREMTWSFAGPDGRATFEWIELDGEPAIRWRRIGGHEVFAEP